MNETEQINRKIPVVLQKQGISRAINEKGRGRNAIFQYLTPFALLFSVYICCLLLASQALCHGTERLEKDIKTPGAYITTEQFKTLHVSWGMNAESNADEISIKDAKGNILYNRKRFIVKGEVILDRSVTSGDGLVFIDKYVVVPNGVSDNNDSAKVLTRRVDRVPYEKLIVKTQSWFANDHYSIVLKYGESYNITKKPDYFKFLPPEYVVLRTIDDRQILDYGKLEEPRMFGNSFRRNCTIVVPILKFDSWNEGDQYIFNFILTRKPPYDGVPPDSWETETRLHRCYADALKKILFDLDVDKLIKSGRYKDRDIGILNLCRKEGISTNLDSVIMWSAFRTEDMNYIEQTYRELEKFKKKRPNYLRFYLQSTQNINDSLLLEEKTTGDVIRDLKKLKGGK